MAIIPPALSRASSLSVCVGTALILVAVPAAQTADTPTSKPRAEAVAPAGERPRLEEWCKANPDKCREMEARRKEREAQCKADPDKCRAEMQARSAERFKQADTNKDGRLTREEAEKGMPGVARRFNDIDTNKDGAVTMRELEEARKARSEQRKGKSS